MLSILLHKTSHVNEISPYILTHLILSVAEEDCYQSHFTDDKIESYRSKVTCLNP